MDQAPSDHRDFALPALYSRLKGRQLFYDAGGQDIIEDRFNGINDATGNFAAHHSLKEVIISDETIKTCIDVVLPPEDLIEAAQRGIEENPANAPAPAVTTGIGAGPLPPSFLAVVTGKRWRNGRTLRVRFVDGDPVLQARLQPYAHQWSDYPNIKFVFGNDCF